MIGRAWRGLGIGALVLASASGCLTRSADHVPGSLDLAGASFGIDLPPGLDGAITLYGTRGMNDRLPTPEESARILFAKARLPAGEWHALTVLQTAHAQSDLFFDAADVPSAGYHVTSLDLSGARHSLGGRVRLPSRPVGKVSEQIKALPWLRALYCTDLRKGGLSFHSVGQLRHLVFFEPPLDVNDDDLCLMENLPRIEWLELEGCMNIRGSFLPRCRNLRYVDLTASGVSTTHLKHLKGLPSLAALCIPGCDRLLLAAEIPIALARLNEFADPYSAQSPGGSGR